MKTKHTPGPWEAVPCHCEPDCGSMLINGPHNIDGRFDAADATLIAAAPDLADALKAIVSDLDHGWPVVEVQLTQARAAIRKAEGLT